MLGDPRLMEERNRWLIGYIKELIMDNGRSEAKSAWRLSNLRDSENIEAEMIYPILQTLADDGYGKGNYHNYSQAFKIFLTEDQIVKFFKYAVNKDLPMLVEAIIVAGYLPIEVLEYTIGHLIFIDYTEGDVYSIISESLRIHRR